MTGAHNDNHNPAPRLICTLGGSWPVVPETYAFTNPGALPLYPVLPASRPPAVGEIWVVATAEAAHRHGERLRQWATALGVPLRMWWPAGMDDLDSESDVRAMADLIHRLVHHAGRDRPPPVLGLAGGRKTMSADLQRAGQLLGHGGLVHVLDRLDQERRDALRAHQDRPDAFTGPLPKALADAFLPVLVAAGAPPSEAMGAEKARLETAAGPLPNPGPVPPGTRFLETVEAIQHEAESLLANYRLQLSSEEPAGNFRALYALPAATVEVLRREHIGTDPARREDEIAWLDTLPKAELHCHLGGILSVPETIEAAQAEAGRVARARRERDDLAADLARLRHWIDHGDLAAIARWLGEGAHGRPDFKALRRRWPGLPEPLGVCAFLLAFADAPAALDALVFGDWRDPSQFHAIGIERYEALGDLQGSGLLQSRAALRATLDILARQARARRITYLELRCSPLNYTRGGLSGDAVIDELLTAAEAMAGHTDLRLIFIASRHGDPERIREHIALAERRLQRDEGFARRFVGFDLAGAEHVRAPAELRAAFRPLRERIIHLTIHAGEGEPVQNIWQAVYELNADRIGHGLTLAENADLLARFRDREIALEMCPSSNDQIVGFRDHLLGRGERPYPLGDYLAEGLRVTVNTDDPGMSRTHLSAEYHKAAALTDGGLSRWQILQLIRNGFRAAFCSHPDRRRHLLAAEKEIVHRLTGQEARP